MRKNLGQHFLTSRNVARSIVAALGPRADETIVEIGPGTGALTALLVERAGRVIAIEKDPSLARTLRDELRAENLSVIEGDVRDFDPRALGLSRYSVIGNIPYYITGKILRTVLSARVQPSRAVFMVQKEVAERILARKTKPLDSAQGNESILSISVKAYGTPRYIRTVGRGAFAPQPRVDSAVIAIEHISRNALRTVDESVFFELLRRGFAHRRKLLRRNLNVAARTLERCNIPENARAENLSVAQWRCLARDS